MKQKIRITLAILTVFLGVTMNHAWYNVSASSSDNPFKNVMITDNDDHPISEVGVYSIFKIHAEFELENNTFHENETSVLQLPASLMFFTDAGFEILDHDNRVIAYASIDKDDKTLTLTYTSYVDEHSNVSGSFYFYARVDKTVVTESQVIDVEITSGNDVVYKGDINYSQEGPVTFYPVTKTGWVSSSLDNTLQYRIILNYTQQHYENAVYYDELGSVGIEYDWSTFKIYKGTWSYYDHDFRLLNAEEVTSQFSVEKTDTSFSVDFGTIEESDGYQISYNVKINYPPADGEIFSNKGVLKSTDTVVHSVERDVRYFEAGGSGMGYVYAIEINKVNEMNEPLEGVVFEIVRSSNGQKFEVTTDSNGYASVDHLLIDQYRITEKKTADGYILLEDPVIVNPEDFNSTTKLATVNLINYLQETEKTSVTVNKVWVGGPGVHPGIEVQLYQNGQAYGNPVILENGEATYTWTDLDKTDNHGADYVYTVDETGVPENYTKAVAGFTITNTYSSPKTSVTMNKIWVGGPSVHPSIEVQLYRNGQAYGNPIILENGEETYTWNNLEMNDATGVAYKYTVDEIGVPEGYEKRVDALNITNIYLHGKLAITGNKVWKSVIGVTPAIQLQLYRNGIAFGYPVTLEPGCTDFTWFNLDIYDENGIKYNYTVDEINVPHGYLKQVNGNTIINTYIGIPEVKTLPKSGQILTNRLGYYLIAGGIFIILKQRKQNKA